MKTKLSLIILILTNHCLIAQVGIGTINPNPSVALDVNYLNKGVLLPRIELLQTTDNTTIPSPPNSILIYNTASVLDVTPGYYYWNDLQQRWIRIIDTTSPGTWSIVGNSGITTGSISEVNFIGTTDNNDLFFRRNNIHAAFLNNAALNTSFGVNSLSAITEGISNTAIGHSSQSQNITGSNNTSIGTNSLQDNSSGSGNVAIGSDALITNLSNNNTAIGFKSLQFNPSGQGNVAIGAYTLIRAATHHFNVAVGLSTLNRNTTGETNVIAGHNAAMNNTIGNSNTGLGTYSLQSLTTGIVNVAVGYLALQATTTGENNTAIGSNAGPQNNTPEISNTLTIGSGAKVSQSNYVRFGNNNILRIFGHVNFSSTSDRRFKENIQPIPLGIDFVNQLNPVEYIRKNNESSTKEWGIIAQELRETLQEAGHTDAGIVQEDADEDRTLSVRYTDLIAPVIKAIQELTVQNEELKTKTKELQSKLNHYKSNKNHSN